MKVLEFLGGAVIGLLSSLILVAGSIFALGSIGRYMKVKNM